MLPENINEKSIPGNEGAARSRGDALGRCTPRKGKYIHPKPPLHYKGMRGKARRAKIKVATRHRARPGGHQDGVAARIYPRAQLPAQPLQGAHTTTSFRSQESHIRRV